MLNLMVMGIIVLFIKGHSADDLLKDSGDATDKSEIDIESFHQDDIVKYIEIFVETSLQAKKSVREGILPLENTHDLYNEMIVILQDIIDLNMEIDNVYKFLHAEGLDKVVAPNLEISYTPLRRQLLILTKQLLDISPTSAKAVIPISIVDDILEIFEKDSDLSVKAYALEILYLWLPKSPKVQARVMKLKGLDLFYHQISNLDVTVIHTLLDLFNKILEEHIEARREDHQETAENAENLVLYQRIGLLERMSTAHVCDGLLNIFEKSLSFIPSTGQIIPSMFDLMKKIKPFCLRVHKGKSKPIEVFNELFQLVKNPRSEKEFEKLGINVTDVQQVLEQYVFDLKYVIRKDEL